MLPTELITRVKKRLGGKTLPQSPTPAQILERGIDEYQNATIRGNNTGNAWAVSEFTLNTTDDTRRYEITVPDFSKALLVSTVPDVASIYGERPLEFTQLEQLPNEWGWLSNSNGWCGLFGGNRGGQAAYVAFYRQVAQATGFKNYMELRPSPKGVEQYRVLYQSGDWATKMTSDLTFDLPFGDVSFYFVTLIADGLLPYCRWSNDENQNMAMRQMLKAAFTQDLQRYERTFQDFIASLTVTDTIMSESFGEWATGY